MVYSYGIDCGHNCYPDIGASGIKQEDVLTKEVGTLVMHKLKCLNREVVDCTPKTCFSVGNSLYLRCSVANNSNVDMYISIHFNCGGGHGVEVFTNGEHFKEAVDVLNNISSLGYANRGIKDGSNLYVIKNTSMKAMLIECSFVDSVEDMNRYNADNLSDAIVKGLTGCYSTVDKKEDEELLEYLVSYNYDNLVDEVYAKKLANALNRTKANGKCCLFNSETPTDYSKLARFVYCVGAPGKLPFTSYATKVFRGADRWETERLVNEFIDSL